MTEEQARAIISPIGGNGGSGDGFLPAYIVGNTPYDDDWLSDEPSGDPITPEEGLLYLVLTPGDYYSGFYRFESTKYVLVGNARIVELTKQEYLALSEQEKNDGTVYFVTDGGGPEPVELPDRGFTPVGTIISVMGVTAPENYLACNGQTVLIEDYPELAAYFEAQFGVMDHFGGDGTTTFGIPDLRGEFLRGTGTNSHTNQGSGDSVGVHQDATTHLHIGDVYGSTYIIIPGTKAQNQGSEYYAQNTDSLIGTGKTSNQYLTLGNGSDNFYDGIEYTSRPTNTSILYCIAVKNIYIYHYDVELKAKDTYTLSERVIGTWVDGKPIYQKTFVVDDFSNPSTTGARAIELQISHNLPLDICTNAFGVMRMSYDNGTTYNYRFINGFFVYPSATSDTSILSVAVDVATSVYVSTSFLRISVGNDIKSLYGLKLYVTLQYTKTTD